MGLRRGICTRIGIFGILRFLAYWDIWHFLNFWDIGIFGIFFKTSLSLAFGFRHIFSFSIGRLWHFYYSFLLFLPFEQAEVPRRQNRHAQAVPLQQPDGAAL
jgi:hypothetical protein